MKAPKKVAKVWAFEVNPGKGSVSSLWSIVLLLICISLYCLSVLKFKSLPDAVPETGEGFSGVRAKNYLKVLSSYGPRVGGSPQNELQTVNHLQTWLNDLKVVAEANGRILDVDVQVSDGSLQLSYSSSSMSAVYHGVKNVVARLRPIGQNAPEHAILLNAHFDSVPTSEGGGDDGSMCAVMLELVNMLSKSETTMKHSVIFLFNGFEENALQGAHAFITQHPWAPSVKAFLNLEAAGSGGREMVFQAGPRHPWLMNHYRKTAPHPYASTMAEEMFQAELIPSDTDYRIFRDYGRIPGMDFAFAYNGYVYHTKYDKEDIFPAESLQHAGENVLPLVESIASSDELADTKSHEDGHVIFYDFFHVALIYYSETTAAIINSILATVGVILLAVSCVCFVRKGEIPVLVFARELGFTMIIQMLSLAVGAGLVMLAAVVYNAAGRSLAWFSSSYLLFFLYFCPFYLGLALGPACFVGFRKGNPLTIAQNAQLFLHVQHLFYIVLLATLTGKGLRSIFLVMIPVFFYNVSLLINVLFKFQARAHAWMFVHLAGQVVPFMWFSVNTVAQFTTFIPMSGRGGALGNPDLLIAGFSIMCAVFLGGFLVPLITVCRSPRITSLMFAVLWILGIILMVTPLGYPFREAKAPQRFNIYHLNRQFHTITGDVRREDSGFFIATTDSHAASVVEEHFEEPLNIVADCQTEFACGFPFGIATSFWFPAQRAVVPDIAASLTLTRREVQGDDVILHFQLLGPARMSLLICANSGFQLSEWSFQDPIPSIPNSNLQGRPVYFISYTNFRLGVPESSDMTEFWLKMTTTSTSADKILDISVTSHYIWYENFHSMEFQEKIARFPPWTSVGSFIVTYDAYEF
ncbi:endoplasmic reticulum metallopeptidase 1 [Sergentomyia squamirostris]